MFASQESEDLRDRVFSMEAEIRALRDELLLTADKGKGKTENSSGATTNGEGEDHKPDKPDVPNGHDSKSKASNGAPLGSDGKSEAEKKLENIENSMNSGNSSPEKNSSPVKNGIAGVKPKSEGAETTAPSNGQSSLLVNNSKQN